MVISGALFRLSTNDTIQRTMGGGRRSQKPGKRTNVASNKSNAGSKCKHDVVSSKGKTSGKGYKPAPRETPTSSHCPGANGESRRENNIVNDRGMFETPIPASSNDSDGRRDYRPVTSIELRTGASETPATALTEHTDHYHKLLAKRNNLVQLEATIKSVVQQHIFPKVKFVQDPDRELKCVSSTSRKAHHSICGLILNNCKLSSSEDEETWWLNHGVKVTKKTNDFEK